MRYRIGELAELCGVSVETVRYYEKRGLIGKAVRTESGYRVFPDSALETIVRIKNAQNLGFSLKEIDYLMQTLDLGKSWEPTQLHAYALDKRAHIERQIQELDALKCLLDKAIMLTSTRPAVAPDQCPVFQSIISGGVWKDGIAD